MPKRIGIIGFGMIGQYLWKRISEDKDLEVSFVYDADKEKIKGLDPALLLESVNDLSNKPTDLVVEVATYQAAKEFAPVVLKYCDMLIFSTCSLADEEFRALLDEVSRQYRCRVYIPHGAILGLDGIRDGREKLQSVSITTIKRPVNLGRDDKERTLLFDGSTREASRLYPRNVNVHAGIAIAGMGFDKTRSTIVSDPSVKGNTHIIEIKAEGVNFKIEVCSEPQGLVTGAYTPVSAFNTVRRICLDSYGIIIV